MTVHNCIKTEYRSFLKLYGVSYQKKKWHFCNTEMQKPGFCMKKTQSQLTCLNLGRGRRINMPSEKLQNHRL